MRHGRRPACVVVQAGHQLRHHALGLALGFPGAEGLHRTQQSLVLLHVASDAEARRKVLRVKYLLLVFNDRLY